MRIAKLGLAAAAVAMLLGGCTGRRVSPLDMTRNQPLLIPPDYGLMPPPPAPAAKPKK